MGTDASLAQGLLTDSDLCLAIDIGGTKISAGLFGVDGHVPTVTRTIPTARDPDPDALWASVVTLVDDVRSTTSAGTLIVCGVGCGGPMSPNGETVSPLNIPAWRGFPLRARLQELTGVPTAVENDAKALALAEGRHGAAAGIADFIAMVVSTGIGGGIVLGGTLLDGRLGNAGHIGHLVVEPDGRPCVCGGRGCLEAEASGTAIAALIGRPAADADAATIARTGTLVGRAVASVANLLDLSLAVVAGSVALGYGSPFFEAAQAEIDRRACLSFSAGTRIVPAGLGAGGPLAGAAAVGWRSVGR